MPEISIIVPFYNSEKYISFCIESILNQTFDNIELLLVDDGSNDKTCEIVNSFNDKRIRKFSQNHAGVSSARNLGIEKAEGNYILFMDSDDFLEKDACEKLMRFAEKNDKFDVCFFNFRFCNNLISKVIPMPFDSKTTKLKQTPLPFKNAKNTVLMFNYVIWNKFYSAEFIKRNGILFNTNYKLSEDLLFSVELFSKNPYIMIFDEVLYNYKLRKDSLSKLSYGEMFATLENMYKYVSAENYYESSFKLFVDNIFLKMGIFIYYNFVNDENKRDISLKVKNILSLISARKNVNIFNSFRYRKLLFLVFCNSFQENLKRKPCIF